MSLAYAATCLACEAIDLAMNAAFLLMAAVLAYRFLWT